MEIYDCVIVGGGPAGLTAAIYLARYNRSCLVIDMGWGRSTNHEINENYLGFPKGINIEKLRELGRLQAERFGAKFIQDKVTKIIKAEKHFTLEAGKNTFLGKTVILATGVTDLWPEFENVHDYIGRSLFWCITCDGHKTIDKKVSIVGDTDDTACTALQFLDFTHQVFIVTNQENKHRISKKWLERLKAANIKIYEGKIAKVYSQKCGYFQHLELDNGEKIKLDFMFNQQGAVPNSELAEEIGVKVNSEDYIKTDHEKRTNIPYFYAAGDVTRLHSHQVVIAAAEGATAGEIANYDLYLPKQKCT